MDDFNAELLKSWEESGQDMADTHDRLRGATMEYHKGKQINKDLALVIQGIANHIIVGRQVDDDIIRKLYPIVEDVRILVDDRYILHGVLSRLMAVRNEEYLWYDKQMIGHYDVVTELINTLTSYLSQS